MKNFLLLFTFMMLANCQDGTMDLTTEEPLEYNNGKLSTGKVSSTGLDAPEGYELSEIKPSLDYGMDGFYLNFQDKARYSVSDDFIVPENESWDIKNISFYVINPEPVSAKFPVKNVVVEIYNGDPELATSSKIYGDFDTNVFKVATPTNIYRITNETTDISKPEQASLVYKVETDFENCKLNAGHYWYKMTMKFNYGEDWSCYIPRLPQEGNNEGSFNAYVKDIYNGSVESADYGLYNGTAPVKYETPFNITGVKTIY